MRIRVAIAPLVGASASFAVLLHLVVFAAPSPLPAEDTPSKVDASAKAEAPKAPPPVELKLLDTGAEPRRTLRLAPEKGHTSSALMTIDMETTAEIEAFPIPPQKLPTQELTFRYEVKDVAPGGDITYAFKILKARIKDADDVVPMIAESLRSTLALLEGLEGTSVVTSRGLPKSTELKLPEKASREARETFANMRQSFQNFAAPLPEEPVGVGARWTAVTEVDVAGAMRVTQTMEYELAAFEKESVRLKVMAEQKAGEQEPGTMQAAEAAKPRLLGLKATGRGETSTDLREVAPGRSEMEMVSETRMSLVLQGERRTLLTRGRVRVKVEPAPRE